MGIIKYICVVRFFIVFILFSSTFSLGQRFFFLPNLDSIDQNYRSGGRALDSTDHSVIRNINLRPGGGYFGIYEFDLPLNVFHSIAGLTYLNYQFRAKPLFSGLPHLGFNYSFGSFGSQELNVAYNQFFKPETHLHINIHRVDMAGALRNSGHELNDINALFYHSRKRIAMKLDVYYASYDIYENQGILTDTLLDFFPIEFTPVKSQNGNTKIKKSNIRWDNYLRLIGDSISGQGIKLNTQFDLVNREYEEQNFSGLAYNTILIDSFSTRDQYQTASIETGGGYFFNSPYFRLDASVNHRFWKYQNLGQFRDTNEVRVNSILSLRLGQLVCMNEFSINLLGAIGEFHYQSNINYTRNKLAINAGFNLENKLPVPHQRFYLANNISWKLSNLELQKIMNVHGKMSYGQHQKLISFLNWTTVSNGLFLIQNEWRQDTLDFINLGTIGLMGQFRFGKFSVYPCARLNFSSNNFNFMPSFTTLNRIAFTTKLFKTKALEVSLGSDFGYDSKYNHLTYNHLTGTMDPILSAFQTPGMMNLHSFMSFQISQFRFYVRAENIDYFWNAKQIRIDPGFPLMPFYLRLGLSWDFFN